MWPIVNETQANPDVFSPLPLVRVALEGKRHASQSAAFG